MKTIFHANRKLLRRPRFAVAYLDGGHMRYMSFGTPFERDHCDRPYLIHRTLYRINVYPRRR
jgi:hypothetical protein